VKHTIALALALVSMSAHGQTIGDWSYQVKRPFYAGTLNDSGHVFGQWCDVDAGSCIYVLVLSTRCDEDESYPVLVNSDTSSLSTTLVCRGRLESGKYRYSLGNFDDIDAIVRKAKRVGIAIPLEGDQFRVVRFSLEGALASLTIMRASAEKAVPVQPTKSTRDQRL
jgi:hypothetical protein